MEEHVESISRTAAGQRFEILVDGRRLEFEESAPVGRRILGIAGIDSVEDSVLIQLTRPGTRSIGLDETVDLRRDGAEAFRAFRSDRIFQFTIDGRGYEWGACSITEAELRDIAAVDEDHVLILGPVGSERELDTGSRMDLGDRGTEHLRTAKRIITVYLNGIDKEHEKRIEAGTYTTEDLIRALGVDAGYLLNVVSAEGALVPLQPGHHLHVKPGMKFVSQVPGGGSS